MDAHSRWFRRVLKLLPEEFRAAYGADMERMFRAQQREALSGGETAVLRLWWETVRDLARTAPREHLEQIGQDVRYAVRMMRRTPSFTAVALVTLAVGIGANTAIFSVVNAVLVRPLPYADTGTLASLWNHWPGSGKASLSYPELLDFRERLESVEIAGFAGGAATLTGRGDPERVRTSEISPNFLDVIGVQPALGRAFRPEEERPGGGTVAILTDEMWRTRFDADPALLGSAITLDRQPYTVVGVLPPGFVMPHEFGSPERSVVLTPLEADVAAPRNERGSHFLRAVARVRAGSSLEQAEAEIDNVTRAFERENSGEYNVGYGATLWPIRNDIVGDVRPALLVLLGAVSLVLLIACANVANLLLARGQMRAREIAVRKAIGATQARLVRQVITESVVLAGIAALAGIALAQAMTTVIARSAPGIPRIDDLRLDPVVLAYTAASAVITALIFGSLPALQLARRGVNQLGSGRGTRSSLRQAVRSALVTAQVALALVLLVGAALLVQSFTKLLRAPAGIDTDGVLTFRVSVPLEGYRERDAVVRFYEQLLDRVRVLPDVSIAGAAANLPLANRIGDWEFYLAGETPTSAGSDRPADWQVVTPGYFEALRIPLVRGRFPDSTDRADSPAIVVINDTLARTYFPGRDPIGQQMRMSGADRPWMTIVGICADVRHNGLDTPANAQVYMPHAQFEPFWNDTTVRSFAFAVRTHGDPVSLVPSIRARVRELDAHISVAQVLTMDAVMERSVAPRRLPMLLLALFAAIALTLATIGTYGVLAYQVTERTQEIGVRMALGARAGEIVRLIVRQGLMPAIVGVILGLAGSTLASRALATLLFETRPLDPAVFGATSAALLLTALLACAIPARRAARIEPGLALRAE